MVCHLCSVDATLTECVAKYVNDGVKEQENCIMRKTIINKNVYLALYAKRVIYEGEELRYDYGVKSLPWRQKHTKQNARRHTELNSASEANSAVNNTSVQSAAATGAGEGSAVLMATESPTAASGPLLSHGAAKEPHSVQSTDILSGGAGEGSAVLMATESPTAASVPLQSHGAAKESHSVQSTEIPSDGTPEGSAVQSHGAVKESYSVQSTDIPSGGASEVSAVLVATESSTAASLPEPSHGAAKEFHSLQSTEKSSDGAGEGSAVMKFDLKYILTDQDQPGFEVRQINDYIGMQATLFVILVVM